MNDLERLIAIEDIKQLQSRRVRAVDAQDWVAYKACHAPEMEQESKGVRSVGIDAVIAKISAHLKPLKTYHHVHSPEITFTSDTTAKGIWVLQDRLIEETERGSDVTNGYALYHDTYRKMDDGRWVFTSRRIERQRYERFFQGKDEHALQARVEALEGRFAIIELPRIYARGIDQKNWDICRSAFTPDCMIDGSRRKMNNREYFTHQEREIRVFAATMHSMHNETSWVKGDKGHVDTYCVAQHYSHANVETRAAPDLVLGVRYHDDCTKIDGRWYISHRRVTPDWRIGTHPPEWLAPTKS